jgi:hypothetical protein
MNVDFERIRGSAAVRELYFASSEGLQERILRADPAVREVIRRLREDAALVQPFRTELLGLFHAPIPEGRRHPEETLLAAGLHVLNEAAPGDAIAAIQLFEQASPSTHGLLGRFARWLAMRRQGGVPSIRTPAQATEAGTLITDAADLERFLTLNARTDPARNTTTTVHKVGGIIRSS